ncbi:MAG: cytochrome c biogenesis CcdA family protein [Acidimicrobiales bacterium]
MIEAPLGLAFAAGLVATLNPCGFAMLPAYLSYFMGLDDRSQEAAADEPDGDDSGRGGAIAESLRVGGIVSLGFLVVFGVTGLLINIGVRSIIDWIPYMALVIGLVMIVLGVAMFRGYQLNIGFLKVRGGGTSRDGKSIFGFGVSYALASLSCTLPVFLSVVVGSIAGTNFISGFLTYIAYGLGMSALLMAVTLAVAFAKQRVVRGLRMMLRYVQKISASFLVIAGIYITWFWIDDLSSDAGEQGAAAGVVEGWSASITNWVQANSAVVGLLVVGSVAIAVLSTVLKRFEAPLVEPAVKSAATLDRSERS